MPTVAERLRRAREGQNLTVHQVAEITKIKTDHIRALEEGNYEIFAAPVYIRGFLRNYAALLKLNIPEVMAALKDELAAIPKFNELPSWTGRRMSPMDRLMFQLSKVNWQAFLLMAVAALLLGLGAWAFQSWLARRDQDPLAHLGPGLYQPRQTNTGEFLPLPTNAPGR